MGVSRNRWLAADFGNGNECRRLQGCFLDSVSGVGYFQTVRPAAQKPAMGAQSPMPA